MGSYPNGPYELIPSPFTVETNPAFPIQTKEEEQTIRVYIEDGIVQDVTGLKANGPLQTVRIIDLDVEGSDGEDRQELSTDDRPEYKVDDNERANGPKPIEAFVTDWNDSGRIA
jgi:hypothetical protein